MARDYGEPTMADPTVIMDHTALPINLTMFISQAIRSRPMPLHLQALKMYLVVILRGLLLSLTLVAPDSGEPTMAVPMMIISTRVCLMDLEIYIIQGLPFPVRSSQLEGIRTPMEVQKMPI